MNVQQGYNKIEIRFPDVELEYLDKSRIRFNPLLDKMKIVCGPDTSVVRSGRQTEYESG